MNFANGCFIKSINFILLVARCFTLVFRNLLVLLLSLCYDKVDISNPIEANCLFSYVVNASKLELYLNV